MNNKQISSESSLKSALFKSFSIKYGLLIPGNLLRTNSRRITIVAHRILVNALGVKYARTFATVWRFIMLSDRKLMARPAIVIPWWLKHAENTKYYFFAQNINLSKYSTRNQIYNAIQMEICIIFHWIELNRSEVK